MTEYSPPTQMGLFYQNLPLELRQKIFNQLPNETYLTLANQNKGIRYEDASQLRFRQFIERLELIVTWPDPLDKPSLQTMEGVLINEYFTMDDVYSMVNKFVNLVSLEGLRNYVEYRNRNNRFAKIYQVMTDASGPVFEKLLESGDIDTAMKIFHGSSLRPRGLTLMFEKGVLREDGTKVVGLDRLYSLSKEKKSVYMFQDLVGDLLACSTIHMANLILATVSSNKWVSTKPMRVEYPEDWEGNDESITEVSLLGKVGKKEMIEYLLLVLPLGGNLLQGKYATARRLFYRLKEADLSRGKSQKFLGRMDNYLELITWLVNLSQNRSFSQLILGPFEIVDLTVKGHFSDGVTHRFQGNPEIVGSVNHHLYDMPEEVILMEMRYGEVPDFVKVNETIRQDPELSRLFTPSILWYFNTVKHPLPKILDFTKYEANHIVSLEILSRFVRTDDVEGYRNYLDDVISRTGNWNLAYPSFLLTCRSKSLLRVLSDKAGGIPRPLNPLDLNMAMNDDELFGIVYQIYSSFTMVDSIRSMNPFACLLNYRLGDVSRSSNPDVALALIIRLGLTGFLDTLRMFEKTKWPSWTFRTALNTSAEVTEWFLKELIKDKDSWEAKIEEKWLTRAAPEIKEVLRRYGLKF